MANNYKNRKYETIVNKLKIDHTNPTPRYFMVCKRKPPTCPTFREIKLKIKYLSTECGQHITVLKEYGPRYPINDTRNPMTTNNRSDKENNNIFTINRFM